MEGCWGNHLKSMKSSEPKKKITASDITSVLAQKHYEDVFIPQCKTGSTWIGKHSIMDAYVIKKSYTNPLSICYEIKVSRQDFINDSKWENYLPFCNEFYFITPHGLVDSTEVPEQAGLMYVSKNCTKAFIKKKAPHRKVDVPDSVYKYILFSRTVISNEKNNSSKEYWQNFLNTKTEDMLMADRVNQKIKDIVSCVKTENKKLKEENALLIIYKESLEELGLTIEKVRYAGKYKLKDNIQKILNIVPETLFNTLNNTIFALQDTKRKLEELNSNVNHDK